MYEHDFCMSKNMLGSEILIGAFGQTCNWSIVFTSNLGIQLIKKKCTTVFGLSSLCSPVMCCKLSTKQQTYQVHHKNVIQTIQEHIS